MPIILSFSPANLVMSDSPLTISNIIGSGRWRRAVFTTFTISLTYFECYVLPRLRAQGCNMIDVYVDTLGYRDSLVEQRSRHAGRDYTVHPVLVKAGIFHPKLIYLWAEEGDGDVLMVGSGNLTYAGHGGSLEVFEILQPALHARAFGQAGAFIEQLLQSRDRINLAGASAPLEALNRRLVALEHRFPNIEDVQFLHSLKESALQQLQRVIGPGPHDELLVMSPYHHPQAAPIKSLVDATRPRKLLVAQDGNARHSPFPFERSSDWDCDVVAVESEHSNNRFMHAKWYQWRNAGRSISFTGSFNATAESLASRNNVECGVLRYSAASSTGWIEVDPLPFAKQVFPRIGDTAGLLVTGEIFGRMMNGQLLGFCASTPRVWQFYLQSGESPPSQPQQVETDEAGAFQVRLANPVDMDSEIGLQIRMHAGAVSARGWVALPDILKIGSRRRTLLASLSEVGRGTESAASFAGFLSIVMDEVRSFVGSASPGAPRPNAPPNKQLGVRKQVDNETEPEGFARPAIIDAPTTRSGSPRDQLVAALVAGQTGWAVWGQLSQMLLGRPPAELTDDDPSAESATQRPRKVCKPCHQILHPDVDDDGDQSNLEKERTKLRAGLDDFKQLISDCREQLLRRIERLAAESAERNEELMNLTHLERLSLHVLLRAHAGPMRDTAGAVHEAANWLHRAVDIVWTDTAREGMLPDFAGCAAVLAYQNRATPEALMDCLTEGRAPSKVMRAAQYLEAAYSRAPDIKTVLELADDWLNSQTGFTLVRGEVNLALSALDVALNRPTPRTVVARFFEECPLQPQPSAWHPFSGAQIALLSEAVRERGKTQRYSQVDVRSVGPCRVCYRDLRTVIRGRDQRLPDPSMLAELKTFFVSRCNCGRGVPLINQIALAKKP